MAGKKKVTKAAKVKKKKWVPVLAPKIFNNVLLGETHVTEDEQIKTKSVKLNLGTVTNDMRKQGFLVRFDVIKVKEGKAYTALTGIAMTPSGMKRLIRRGRSKVEDSFLTRLKDGEIVRVKPVVVTINSASKAAQTSIRLAIREKLKDILSKSTLDSFVNEVLQNKIQKILKDVANKSHPIRTADVKAIQLLPKSKGNLGAAEDVDSEKPTEEPEEAKSEEKPAEKQKVEQKAEKPETKKQNEDSEKPKAPKTVAKKAAKKAVKKVTEE